MRLPALAWRNLWRNRRRTLLTLSAIAFGTFLSIMFTAMQDRNYADMIDMAARLGGGHVVVQDDEYLDTPTLTRTVADTGPVRAKAEADPAVTHVVDRITGQAMVATASRNAGVMFVAFDPAREDDTTLSFLQGVQGTLTDPRGLVLGARLAHNLQAGLGDKVVYTLMDRTGEIVSGMGRVTGLLKSGAASVDGGVLLVPIDAMRATLGYGPHEATSVAVFLSDARKAPAVVRRLGPSLPPGEVALTWDQSMPDLSGFIAMKVGGARFMELVLLVLVAAGIFNTLFMSVMERRREFGILAALGTSPRQIFLLVMWESLWLALVGLVAAAVVTIGPYSYLHANGIDMSARLGTQETIEVAGVGLAPIMRFEIFPESLALIALFAVGATLVAGIWPAAQAARVAPVDAIKMV
jgi:ABC-type lipoprotein release transport system permease subunit